MCMCGASIFCRCGPSCSRTASDVSEHASSQQRSYGSIPGGASGLGHGLLDPVGANERGMARSSSLASLAGGFCSSGWRRRYTILTLLSNIINSACSVAQLIVFAEINPFTISFGVLGFFYSVLKRSIRLIDNGRTRPFLKSQRPEDSLSVPPCLVTIFFGIYAVFGFLGAMVYSFSKSETAIKLIKYAVYGANSTASAPNSTMYYNSTDNRQGQKDNFSAGNHTTSAGTLVTGVFFGAQLFLFANSLFVFLCYNLRRSKVEKTCTDFKREALCLFEEACTRTPLLLFRSLRLSLAVSLTALLCFNFGLLSYYKCGPMALVAFNRILLEFGWALPASQEVLSLVFRCLALGFTPMTFINNFSLILSFFLGVFPNENRYHNELHKRWRSFASLYNGIKYKRTLVTALILLAIGSCGGQYNYGKIFINFHQPGIPTWLVIASMLLAVVIDTFFDGRSLVMNRDKFRRIAFPFFAKLKNHIDGDDFYKNIMDFFDQADSQLKDKYVFDFSDLFKSLNVFFNQIVMDKLGCNEKAPYLVSGERLRECFFGKAPCLLVLECLKRFSEDGNPPVFVDDDKMLPQELIAALVEYYKVDFASAQKEDFYVPWPPARKGDVFLKATDESREAKDEICDAKGESRGQLSLLFGTYTVTRAALDQGLRHYSGESEENPVQLERGCAERYQCVA